MNEDWESCGDQMWQESNVIETIMNEWTSLISASDPWRSMIRDDRTGEMTRVLTELLDRGGDSRARRRRLRHAAANHGTFRRRQRCEEGVLAQDFASIRDLLHRQLLRSGISRIVGDEAFHALSSDCGIARRAAHAAYVGSTWDLWQLDD